MKLAAPVMTAAGTTGYGDEFAAYQDVSRLGAVVTKSLSIMPWDGNPSPRVAPASAGMLNAVGLQGPGIERWIGGPMERLLERGASVVVSIWGRTVDEYAAVADAVATAPPGVVAVEVNLSCPNLAGKAIFAHDPDATAAVMSATVGCGRPRWAKLSPNTDRLTDVAAAAQESGAEAVTLINTVMGLAVDPDTRRPVLGNGAGGLSGPAIHPVAVRAVHECRRSLPNLPIVGAGGVTSARTAVELMLVGASAVQVGTAHFADPAAAEHILDDLIDWSAQHGVRRTAELTGGLDD